MPLIRGFSEVDNEGRVAIPAHIQRELGCSPGSWVEITVIRIRGSRRWPHLIVHHPKNPPHLSELQVSMMAQQGAIDEEGRLHLEARTLEEVRLKARDRVELKIVGPSNGSWVVMSNRGPNRLTTLQQRLGRYRQPDGQSRLVEGRPWRTQRWGY